MIAYTTLQLSETLGFMSVMAALVSVWRLVRLRAEVRSVAFDNRYDLSLRRMFLIGFAVYMLGAAMRETVVLWAGVLQWSDMSIIMSSISRVIQIVGACVYVRAATLPRCGEIGWLTVLLSSVAFSLVSPR